VKDFEYEHLHAPMIV